MDIARIPESVFKIFAFVFIMTVLLLIQMKKRRDFLNRCTEENVGNVINDLFKAIQRKDIRIAYRSFRILAPFFDKDESEVNERRYGIFFMGGYRANSCGVLDVDWKRLKEELVDILNKYMSFDLAKRSMSVDQINALIMDLSK